MKKYLLRASMLSFAAMAVLSMSGCGGSSSSSDDRDDTPSVGDVISTAGKVVDGYLVYSTVCLDLSKDGYCQLGEEPATSTGLDGSYTLEISVEQQQHVNFSSAPLLVYGGYDSDTNADFTGKLKASFDAEADSVNITPLTTMVEAMVAKGKEKAEAESAVKKMLGLDTNEDLGADPVEKAKNENGALLKAALQLQKSLEVLSAALEENGVDESSNELIEQLYSALAEKLHADDNLGLDAALDEVVENRTDLNDDAKDKAKASAKAVTGQISTLIGDGTVTGTAVIGTQISAMKEKIVEEVYRDENFFFNPQSGLGDEFFGDLNDFQLLHAYEILNIVDYDGDKDTMAQKVKDVFVAAGMNDYEFLPVETEISALKENSETQAIGEDFEKRMQGFKDDADGTELLANMESVPFSVPMTIYNFSDSEMGDTLMYQAHSILTDGVFEEYRMTYNDQSGEFEKSTSGDAPTSYTLSVDNLELTVGHDMVKIVKKVDLANPDAEAMDIVNQIKSDLPTLNFASGSEAYVLAFKNEDGGDWRVDTENLEFNKAAFDSILSAIKNSMDSDAQMADNSSPLVGSWVAGDDLDIVMVFADNSHYFMAQGVLGENGVAGGVELGDYTLDGNTASGFSAFVNSNADDSAVGSTMTYNPDNDTVVIQSEEEDVILHRQKDADKPWIGSYVAQTDEDKLIVMLLAANGKYMVSDIDLNSQGMVDDGDMKYNAFEMGMYSDITQDGDNLSIKFTIDSNKDFNGDAGMNNNETLTFDISQYPTVKLGEDANAITFNRIQPNGAFSAQESE